MANESRYPNKYLKLAWFLTALMLCKGAVVYDFDSMLDRPKDMCDGKVENCYCTDTVIDCDGATFKDIREIYPYVTNYTIRVSIINGFVETLPIRLFQTSDESGDERNIKYLNLSGNPLNSVSPSVFIGLENLQVLDLSTDPAIDPAGMNLKDLAVALNPLKELKKLFLRHIASNDEGLDDLVDKLNMTKLMKLDLSNNSFTSFDTKWKTFLCNAYELTFLNLSNNNFDHLPATTCITNLRVLDMSNNKLQYLSDTEIDILESLVNLETIILGGNHWSCTCYMDSMLPWLNATNLPLDFNNICCFSSNDDTLIGQPIHKMKIHDLCAEPKLVICYGPVTVARATFYWIATAGVLLLAVVFVTVVCLIRRKRKRQQPGQISRMIDSSPKTPSYSRIL